MGSFVEARNARSANSARGDSDATAASGWYPNVSSPVNSPVSTPENAEGSRGSALQANPTSEELVVLPVKASDTVEKPRLLQTGS
jgi:hypothetical protein